MIGLSKQLSKVRLILNKKKKSQKQKRLTLNCSAGSSTESLLSQLEEAQHEQITHLTLEDSLQRPDNVRIFNALSSLVQNGEHKQCSLRQILLIEPRVKAVDYRRWCFKKTNFLRHVYQLCKEREIRVKIQGTLHLETPEDKPQDISSWLTTHFPKTIPQDTDITSLEISLRDVKPKPPAAPVEKPLDHRRRLSLPKRPVSDVEQVFQGLIEVFNNDSRAWNMVNVHILYTTVPKYAAPQTEALVEVAQIYDIPLQVQWQPLDHTKKAHGTWTRTSRKMEERPVPVCTPTVSKQKKQAPIFPSNPPRGRGKTVPIEDTTASTVDYEGSSGAFF